MNELEIITEKNKKFIKQMTDCVYYCKKFNELNELFELDKNKIINKDLFQEINCYISCYNLYKK